MERSGATGGGGLENTILDMRVDEFWQIVDEVHQSSKGEMPMKCQLLRERLDLLPNSETVSFAEHFANCLCRAYSWELWNAAAIINRGCSNDSFWDFRSTLISMGQEVFEAGLTDPDNLADFDIIPRLSIYEGYQYVARRTRGNGTSQLNIKLPASPIGVSRQPWEFCARFPKLSAKFNYKDSDHFEQKARHERNQVRLQLAERISQFLLNEKIGIDL